MCESMFVCVKTNTDGVCVCAVRQEEKRRLLRRNNELKNEQVYLEEQDKKLNDTIKVRTAAGLNIWTFKMLRRCHPWGLGPCLGCRSNHSLPVT